MHQRHYLFPGKNGGCSPSQLWRAFAPSVVPKCFSNSTGRTHASLPSLGLGRLPDYWTSLINPRPTASSNAKPIESDRNRKFGGVCSHASPAGSRSVGTRIPQQSRNVSDAIAFPRRRLFAGDEEGVWALCIRTRPISDGSELDINCSWLPKSIIYIRSRCVLPGFLCRCAAHPSSSHR